MIFNAYFKLILNIRFENEASCQLNCFFTLNKYSNFKYKQVFVRVKLAINTKVQNRIL